MTTGDNKFMIKIYPAIFAAMMMVGCAAKFDNNEYSRLVDMRHQLHESRCANDSDMRVMISELVDHSSWLLIYSKYLPNNDATVVMLDSYTKTLADLQNNYKGSTPSIVYCRIKIKTMQEQLDIMLRTTASRPRS
jgi:hypothetical protein